MIAARANPPGMLARIIVAVAALLAGVSVTGGADLPRLTAHERSQGWKFLFDGLDTSSWHGYGQNKVPENWTVAAGELRGREGKLIATDEQFRDFELTFEWKVAEGGSATVYFRVSEDFADPDKTGLKLELAGAGVESGGNGGLSKVWTEIRVRPDTWTRGKIVVFGNQVDYWVNGVQVLSYLIDGTEWRMALASSRYAANKEYGQLREGPIALAAEGGAFRNIKVRVP